MPKVSDPLCPLGFHPQVRWPTRCKRCFREYKEHLNATNRKDNGDSSSTQLRERSGSMDSLNESKTTDSIPAPVAPVRSREATALSRRNTTEIPMIREGIQEASSDAKGNETEKSKDYSSIYSSISTTALARLNKIRSSATSQDSGTGAIAKSSGDDFDTSRRGSSGDEGERLRRKRIQIHSLKEIPSTGDNSYNSPDVQFILEVKRSNARARGSDDDGSSTAGTDITELTETTETTLVETNYELQDQVNSLKKEIDKYRARCERLEREKDELSNKKFRSVGMNGGTGSESMRLQQRIRELETSNEDLLDDKRSAELRVTELERELESRPSSAQTHKAMEELRAKSAAAEALIEELMEENEELKKDMRLMVDEMDELQDNFREDQADEYRDLKKDLEQTAKNCRILQFKLRKAERRMEQLESEKHELDSQIQEFRNGNPTAGASNAGKGQDRISQLEQELSQTRDQLVQSQREVQKLQSQIRVGGKEVSTAGPVLSKSRSLEGTSAGLSKSNEDVTQLQRDLQDSLEREADLREQLKFAEEEAQSLRKKMSRIEEENESLVMQLKKMAMKKGGSGATRRNPSDSSIDKDEGISGDMDELTLSELRLQLELNEQETAVLRRKMEDMEGENDRLSKEVLELQEQVKTKPSDKTSESRAKPTKSSDEINKLKNELMEKDKEIQHLNEALNQAEKSKNKVVVQRSRSLESESALDLKRQLQLVEQEVAILRSKTVDLESENDKMTAENRRLQLRVSRKPPPTDAEKLLLDKLELEERIKAMEKKLTEAASHKPHSDPEKSPRLGRVQDRTRLSTGSISPESSVLKREKEILERDLKSKEEQISSLTLRLQNMEKENENLHHRMDTRIAAVKRVPKKPSETMTKLQLKKMAEELEAEVTDLISKISTGQTLSSANDTKKIDELTKNLKEEKEQREKLANEKKKVDEQLVKLEAEAKKGNGNDSAANKLLREKCEKLEKEKDELTAKMQTGDFVDLDTLHQVKQEKHKLQKELTERDARLSDLEKKIKDSEDKNKKLERSLKDNKDRITDLEREMEEERSKLRQNETSHKEISLNWLKERDELKKQTTDMRSKVDDLEALIVTKDKKIKDLDSSTKDEVKKGVDTALKKVERDIKAAKDEAANFKSKIDDLELKLTRAEMDKKGLNERIQRQEADWRKERDQLIGRATDLEVEIKAERKKRDRAEKEYEQDMRDKDDEVIGLKERIKRTEIDMKAALERYEELKNQDTRSRELELELEREHQDYEDLTAKYDLLEEDYVVIKAKLVMDKESIEKEYLALKKEHDTVEGELRALRETFNLRQDTWIKEKLDMQEKVKELEEKELRHSGESWYIERSRLKDIIDEKNQQLEKMKRDEDMHRDHIDNIRRENDELRRKLEDFDKVTKIKKSMTFDSTEHDREIRELKNRLAQEEKAHRSEMTHTKMRVDNKIAILQEETQATQMQLEKARRERDTFREMLDGAQRMIADLKADPSKRTKSGVDEARSREIEDNMSRIEEFHARITSLEDELNEARTETSRIKTEYINDKSTKDIKISELQTKINELEEDKIMAMGRSRITGTKTRLELAWQKEREEQQRLIQESSTLARDLRQTLLEVEKERDRERLETRRRLEQQKRANEEEQVEIRKKVTELQSDLLELRDAHAKLRTSCEKLRRDKERVERERDETKKTILDSRKADNDIERRIGQLLVEVQKMKDLCPLVLGESLRGEVPSDLKRAEKDVRQEKVREEFMSTLRFINQCGEEVKRLQQREGDDNAKRAGLFRRAMSNAPGDSGSSTTNYGTSAASTATPVTKRAPVYRRSLSLEQSQNIKEAESKSSISSSSYMDDETSYSTYRSRTVDRDPSLDRISTDSTRSESAVTATPEIKKKRSLMGKIKQLTKSRSIEETGTANQLVNAGIQALIPSVSVNPSGSDLSLDKDPDRKREKKTVKDKLTGMFKKNPSSRTSSMERSDSTESRDKYTPSKDVLSTSVTERPLQRPPSLSNLSTHGSSRGTTPLPPSRATPSRGGMLRNQNSFETDV